MLLYIYTLCDHNWVWEKPPSTHTTARHTFHHQTIAVHTNRQFSQVLMLKVALAAFAVACFWGLSDAHECSGRLQMVSRPLDKYTAGCNSPHDWLMSLAKDLAALCDIWKWKWHKLIPFHVAVYNEDVAFAATSVATHPPPPHPPPASTRPHPIGVLILFLFIIRYVST